jgi:hypothetical protein
MCIAFWSLVPLSLSFLFCGPEISRTSQGRRKRRGKVLEEREKPPLKLFLDSSVKSKDEG